MAEREGLVAAITANPKDKLLRQVFADWLEERDENELAASLRADGWDGSGMEGLIGKTILGLSVSDDQSLLAFTLANGPFVLRAEGDCCSESWFYRVRGVVNLIGATVLLIQESPVDDVDVNDGLGRQEEDSAYGVGLVTDRGIASVVYRCSSNGYYGGWVEKTKEHVATDGFQPITCDWQHTT
jgi:uncharacterized protein (TIGR02996 family)